jgi:hypothetical protein
MTNEIKEAFEEFDNGKLWRLEDRFLDGFPQAYFEAGYTSGAEAKVIQLSWEYDQILKDKDKERFESILAERARVLGQVREYLRALKEGWTTDEAWGRAVIDTCELLEHKLKEHG